MSGILKIEWLINVTGWGTFYQCKTYFKNYNVLFDGFFLNDKNQQLLMIFITDYKIERAELALTTMIRELVISNLPTLTRSFSFKFSKIQQSC
jgi:hypothetical protein